MLASMWATADCPPCGAHLVLPPGLWSTRGGAVRLTVDPTLALVSCRSGVIRPLNAIATAFSAVFRPIADRALTAPDDIERMRRDKLAPAGQ